LKLIASNSPTKLGRNMGYSPKGVGKLTDELNVLARLKATK
jgi:hypothetical protein